MSQQTFATIRPWLCLKKGKVYLQHYPRPLYPPAEFGFRQFLLYPNNISIMTGGICTVLRAGRICDYKCTSVFCATLTQNFCISPDGKII